MGLPDDLLKEMQRFQYMKPPDVSELPKTGLPSLGLPPMVLIEEEVSEEGETKIVGFNLDDFLK